MTQSIHSFTFHVVLLPVVTPNKLRYKLFASMCSRVNFQNPFDKNCDVPENVEDMDKWAARALADLWPDKVKHPSQKWTYVYRTTSEAKAAYDAVYLHHRDIVLGLGPAICVQRPPQPPQQQQSHLPIRLPISFPVLPGFMATTCQPLTPIQNPYLAYSSLPNGPRVAEERDNVAFNVAGCFPRAQPSPTPEPTIRQVTQEDKERDEIWDGIDGISTISGDLQFLESFGSLDPIFPTIISAPVAIPDVVYADLDTNKTAKMDKRKRTRVETNQSKFISFS